MSYALELSESELARYRFMAEEARAAEADLWTQAGIEPGARVADVGCGPGAVLALLAETVGANGHVSGVDGDQQAIAAAETALGGLPNVDLSVGRADATGLEAGTYDVVMLRHVLAHNGGSEQAIVDHVATLVRPGGCVYIVDVDVSMLRVRPEPEDLSDINDRYVEFLRKRGNDPQVGLRLGELVRAAGLEVLDLRGWFTILPIPAGVRPPAVAAAAAMLSEGVVTVDDVQRWTTAFDRLDAEPERPTLFAPLFLALARRAAAG